MRKATDYVGKYTTKFEASSDTIQKIKGDCLFGTYRLSFKSGDVVKFLEKYYNKDAFKDSKKKPSADAVSRVWKDALAEIGETAFFSNERDFLKAKSYSRLLTYLKQEGANTTDRCLREALWSLCAEYKNADDVKYIISTIDFTSDWLDALYDRRFEKSQDKRFSNDEDSERSVLRAIYSYQKEGATEESFEEDVSSEIQVEEQKEQEPKEETPVVTEEVKEATKEKAVKEMTPMQKKVLDKLEKKMEEAKFPYRLLINERFPIYASASKQILKTFLFPGLYTIYEEKNGFGRLKTGSWVDLSMKFVEKV